MEICGILSDYFKGNHGMIWEFMGYLWQSDIAMENEPFIDDLQYLLKG